VKTFEGGKPVFADSIEKDVKRADGEESIKDRCEETTDEILQNLPHGDRIYAALESNAASFVLMMHFVICCLHRADAVPHSTPEITDAVVNALGPGARQRTDVPEVPQHRNPIKPFCASRAEGPGAGGPASHALRRIELLKQAIEASENGKRLSGFRYESTAKFQPRSALQMQMENASLKESVESLVKEAKDREAKHTRELQSEQAKAGSQLRDKKFVTKMWWNEFWAPAPSRAVGSESDIQSAVPTGEFVTRREDSSSD
jgi:hypothetical protein